LLMNQCVINVQLTKSLKKETVMVQRK